MENLHGRSIHLWKTSAVCRWDFLKAEKTHQIGVKNCSHADWMRIWHGFTPKSAVKKICPKSTSVSKTARKGADWNFQPQKTVVWTNPNWCPLSVCLYYTERSWKRKTKVALLNSNGVRRTIYKNQKYWGDGERFWKTEPSEYYMT